MFRACLAEHKRDRFYLNIYSQRNTMNKTFTAIIHKEEDIYVANCPEVGTVSQGKSIEEAIANLKESTGLCLKEFPLPGITLPSTTTWKQKQEYLR